MFQARSLCRVAIWRHAAFVAVVTGLSAGSVSAQQFQRAYGTADDERPEWIANTNDGGFVMCGGRATGGDFRILVVKTDSTGALSWDTEIDSPGGDSAYRIEQTLDDGYILCGSTTGAGAGFGLSLIKLNSVGALQWAYAFPATPGTGPNALEEQADGGFLLASRLQATAHNAQAPVLVRTDQFGNLQWAYYYIDLRYGTTGFADFKDVHSNVIPGAFGIVATGYTAPFSSVSRETLVMQLGADGSLHWAKTYDQAGHMDWGAGIEPADNMDLIVNGYTKAIGEGGGTYLMRLDPFGGLQWYKTFFHFKSTDSSHELLSGDIILGGSRDDFVVGDPAMLLTNAAGTFQWAMSYGGAVSEPGEAVIPVPAGGFAVVGWTGSFGGGSRDYHMIRTDNAGMSDCLEESWIPILGDDTPPVVDLDIRRIAMDTFVSLPLTQAFNTTVETNPCTTCVEPPAPMAAWWPLDVPVAGDPAAELVHNNWGWLLNGASPFGGGMVDGAVCFDGNDDQVFVPDAGSLNFDQGDFSIDAWIRTTTTSGIRVIVDKRDIVTSGATGYQLFLVNGEVGLQMADGSGSLICSPQPTASCTNFTSGVFVATGAWEHVAVTVKRNAPNGGTWYHNGLPVGGPFDPTVRPDSMTNPSPLAIGGHPSNAGDVWDGCIDEVELFNRELDPAEIFAIYDAGSAGKCKDPCLADWNGDGSVNTLDFLAYLNDYVAVINNNTPTYGNPDLAPPFGSLSTIDLLAYFNLFASGCN